jgi:hypothetical protein
MENDSIISTGFLFQGDENVLELISDEEYTENHLIICFKIKESSQKLVQIVDSSPLPH